MLEVLAVKVLPEQQVQRVVLDRRVIRGRRVLQDRLGFQERQDHSEAPYHQDHRVLQVLPVLLERLVLLA